MPDLKPLAPGFDSRTCAGQIISQLTIGTEFEHASTQVAIDILACTISAEDISLEEVKQRLDAAVEENRVALENAPPKVKAYFEGLKKAKLEALERAQSAQPQTQG